ncbi:MAG: uroporphyrinogen-III C-methyltransferase [Gammaproteobacteria bacterium]|nr:uroporphyrinogen-III C-methyltransferase [Gammaproteobacteria bacterium]
MVERTETPKILEEISKANAKADARPSNQKKARRRFTIVAVLFLSFLGAVSYLGWQQSNFKQVLDNLYQENQEMGLLVESQSSQIFGLQESISRFSNSEKTDQIFKDELASLQQQFEDLSVQQSRPRSEPNLAWKLDEAMFFLRMANQKLQMQGDIISTISLIESADIALLDSGLSGTFPVRQALAESLSELRGTEVIDREGIFIRLGDLRKRAGDIKLMSEQNGIFSNKIEATTASIELEGETKSTFDLMIGFLSSVFVLRDWEDKSEFILAGGHPELIRQNLYLMLEQARFAVITKNKTLYQQSLLNSRKWFETYVSSNFSSELSFSEEISSLMLVDINPSLPDLTESLVILNSFRSAVEAVR